MCQILLLVRERFIFALPLPAQLRIPTARHIFSTPNQSCLCLLKSIYKPHIIEEKEAPVDEKMRLRLHETALPVVGSYTHPFLKMQSLSH